MCFQVEPMEIEATVGRNGGNEPQEGPSRGARKERRLLGSPSAPRLSVSKLRKQSTMSWVA